MKVNRNYDALPDLKDLLIHILRKWYIILPAALIAAGVLGFREYWSFGKYHRNGEQAPAEAQYEATAAAIGQTEEELAAYDEKIRKRTEYRDTSILMKIDPTNIWTAEKKYYLNLDGSPEDHSYSTMTALSEAFPQDLPSKTRNEVFGTTIRNDIKEVACICLNRGLRTISVIGSGSTEEEAVRRKEFADSYLHAAEQNLKETYIFTLDVLSDSVGTRTTLLSRNDNGDIEEKDLAATQDSVLEHIKNYENQRQTSINTLNAQKAQLSVKPAPKTVLYAAIGFAAGFFLATALYVVFYLFNGKLKNSRELQNRYDIDLLADLHPKARPEALRKELEIIAALIDPEKDGKQILMTGTLKEAQMKQIFEGLKDCLQQKGIELTLQPEYLKNTEASAAVLKADSVIITEKKGKSRFSDLNRLAETLSVLQTKVKGAILT